MVRIFIAVEPEASLRCRIAETGKSLVGAGRTASVDADLMHITLKFLGEIPESRVSSVISAIDGVSAAPYSIEVSGVGTFGRPPRVVKAEVHDGGQTKALAKEVDRVLSPLGFVCDAQKFSPHITMARIKEYSPAILPKIAAVRNTVFGTAEIAEILVKKSVLTPNGPVYSTLHRTAL